MKKSIFSLDCVKPFTTPQAAAAIARFLVDHRDLRIDDISLKQLMNTSKTPLKTPISTLVENALSHGVLEKMFSVIHVPKNIDIPESLLFRYITFDIKQLALPGYENARKLINVYGEYKDTVLIDASGYINPATEQIIDTTEYYNMLVQGLLVRSYYVSDDNWLSADAISFIVKSYSMTISNSLSRTLSLDDTGRKMLAILFGYFYATQMVSDEGRAVQLTLNALRFMGINTASEVLHVKEAMEAALGKQEFTFRNMLSHTGSLGINRLPNLSIRDVHRSVGQIGRDPMRTLLFYEYPPVFAAALMQIACNTYPATNLNFMLNKTFNMKKELVQFAQAISTDHGLLQK